MTLQDRAKELARRLALNALKRLNGGSMTSAVVAAYSELEPAREDVKLIEDALASAVVDAGLAQRLLDEKIR